MSENQNTADPGSAFFGNEWVSQIGSEHDRADRAEETLSVHEAEADHITLRAAETAAALLVFAQEVAIEVVRSAQARAESVLAVAQATAQQLIVTPDGGDRRGPADAVAAASPGDLRSAEGLLADSRTVAEQEVGLRHAVAAEALAEAQRKAAAILEVARAKPRTD